MSFEIKDPKTEPKKVSVKLSPSFLAPMEEREHFGLYRHILIGDVIQEKPLGPLMVLRIARDDDQVDMRSSDPRTGEPLSLTKVMDARDDPKSYEMLRRIR